MTTATTKIQLKCKKGKVSKERTNVCELVSQKGSNILLFCRVYYDYNNNNNNIIAIIIRWLVIVVVAFFSLFSSFLVTLPVVFFVSLLHNFGSFKFDVCVCARVRVFLCSSFQKSSLSISFAKRRCSIIIIIIIVIWSTCDKIQDKLVKATRRWY